VGLPAGSYSPFEVSYLDAGNEIGRCQGWADELTSDNFDDQAALWATFLSTMDAITLGARVKDRYNDESTYNVSQPTNGAARELKLLVQMQNSNDGRKFHFTVPTLDPTIPAYVENVNAKDVVQVTTPSGITAFIAAVNAFVRDPLDPTHSCAVIGLKVVGRNT